MDPFTQMVFSRGIAIGVEDGKMGHNTMTLCPKLRRNAKARAIDRDGGIDRLPRRRH